MKTINFNCKEILPALLDRSKVQTIRRAFELKVSDSLEGSNISNASIEIPKDFDWVEKPAKFKVGDRVKLYWKKTSKYDWFCKSCGNGVGIMSQGRIKYFCDCSWKNVFEKCLGTVEITEVFKVTIHKSGDIRGVYNIHDLITKDGFRTMIDFTNYFDENYDLSTPKPFWVYRWKYLEGE